MWANQDREYMGREKSRCLLAGISMHNVMERRLYTPWAREDLIVVEHSFRGRIGDTIRRHEARFASVWTNYGRENHSACTCPRVHTHTHTITNLSIMLLHLIWSVTPIIFSLYVWFINFFISRYMDYIRKLSLFLPVIIYWIPLWCK